MIKAAALSELLKRSLKYGIDSIFICTISGEVLAKEGNESTQTMTDIISSIWTDYSQFGESILENEKLNYLIIENDESMIIAAHLYGYIIAMKADSDKNIGQLKFHLESIVKFLSEKLIDFKDVLIERAGQ